MPGLTTATLRHNLPRLAAAMETAKDELNTADGKLGDGDIGITMTGGMRSIGEITGDLPDDVGMALLKCAQAFTKISGSSFGTLLATGLMSAAKACKGRTEIPWVEMSGLVAGAVEAMKARGKSDLGAKTVLDPLNAIALATDGLDDPEAILAAAGRAVSDTMDEYRGKVSTLGRARMFGDKSIGLDDPGMLVLARLVEGLKP